MKDVERFERKFLLDEARALHFAKAIRPFLPADSHGGERGYLVRSVYFDTPRDRDLKMALSGEDGRKKIRLRVYEPESYFAMLELKQKKGNLVRKRSLRIPREDAERLLKGDFSTLIADENRFIRELGQEMMLGVYRPKCMVEYTREAYGVPENNTRVTFDRQLTVADGAPELFSKSFAARPFGRLGTVVLEVKYAHFLLTYVNRALGESLMQPESFSKYCLARQSMKKGRV